MALQSLLPVLANSAGSPALVSGMLGMVGSRVARPIVCGRTRLWTGRRSVSTSQWMHRQAMLVEGGGAQVSKVNCVCAVDGRLAAFQIDCGSTFSQIAPPLAPERVPRFGLGSADCLGSRRWFPTCKVHLAPVGPEGDTLRLTGEAPEVRVQIGAVNLLGLLELRRWCVQLTFTPGGCLGSVGSLGEVAVAAHSVADSPEASVPLTDALRAAEMLNTGEVVAEEAVNELHPGLVDVLRVLEVSHARRPATIVPEPFALQPLAARRGRQTSLARRMRQASKIPGMAAAVLFGTADALVSETMLPPLLPPPLHAAWPEVYFGTPDALVSETIPPPLLTGP